MNAGLAFFDVDGTLVRGDCGVLFARFCALRGLLSARELAAMIAWAARSIRGGIGEAQVVEAKRMALHFRARVGEARCDALYDECFRKLVRPRLRQEVIAELRAAGDRAVLVTANLRDLSLRLGEELDIPPERCLGAEGERRQGKLTGELRGVVPMAEERARLVRAWLERERAPRSESSAYGDSIHDAPMLREVGRPCAVHASPALRALALREGWRLIG